MCNKKFVHLHNHSKFSLLDGIITPETLLPRLETIGMDTFAITDHGTMSGIPEFVKAAKDKIKIIPGCEMYEVDDITLKTAEEASDTESMECESVTKAKEKEESAEIYGKKNPRYWHLTLIAKNAEGYHKLTRLTAAAATADAFYYKPRVDRQMLRDIVAGGDVFVGLGCALSRSSQYALQRDEYEGWSKKVDFYAEVFGEENVFCEIMSNSYEGQAIINPKVVEWATRKGLPIVPTNDCHYVEESHARLQDILLCVSTGQKADAENRKFKFEGSSYYVRSEQEMRETFKKSYDIDIEPWIGNSRIIADQCEHGGYIMESKFRLPRYTIPNETAVGFKNWIESRKDSLAQKYPEETLRSALND